jgi:CheY-like chemotaxis protein/nitrogen-specific signal transduction histidine kinase
MVRALAQPGGTASASAPTVRDSLLAGRRILVVDDSETACVILRLMLERQGAAVETVTSGAAAIAAVRRDAPGYDLVLMDLVMEGIDGFAAIEQIRALRPGGGPAIIAMSATVTPEISARCVALGTHPRLLRKPYRAAEVLDCIKELLNAVDTPARAQTPSADAPVAVRQIDGFDHQAALTRCGGDVALLRSLLGAMQLGLARSVRDIADALAAGDRAAAASRLHRLRGEALNLGLDEIARGLAAIEDELALGKPAERLAVSAFAAERAAGNTLREALASLADTTPEARRDLDPAGFQALIEAMARLDPSAPSLVPPAGRLLPDRYAEADDARFRQHLDSLDFDAARGLLAPEDDRSEQAVASVDPTILIVDDHPAAVRLMARMLAPVCRLRFALSGERALTLARRSPPDLVVADINMGDMSGIALCAALKSELGTADVPVILVSADQDVATEARALTAGAVDFIEKPLNAARVLSRVTAQLDMRRRAAEMRALLSGGRVSTSLGFLMCDPEGRLTDLGSDVAAALGLDRDAAVGGALADLLAADGQAALAAELAHGLAAGSLGPIETVLRGPDGGVIPARLYGRVVSGAEGRRFWIKLDDMRDRVRLERDRLEREKAAAIFSITAGIAHEFNNILGIVLGNIDSAIEEIGEPGKLAKRLRDAQAAAERGADISRAMLASAQREQTADGETLAIDDVLTELWPILANSVPKRMTIRREPSGRPLRCAVSPDGLRGALIALLHNAADAHPGRGTITIRCFEEPAGAGKGSGMAAIEVNDDGPGMPADVQRRAFDPFFTTRAPYRVGLGLTTVFSFAVRHNGSVDIRSAPGRGTSVTLHLPLAPPVSGA